MLLQCLASALLIKSHRTDPIDGIILAGLRGIRFCPEFGRLIKLLSLVHVHPRHLGILRVAGLRRAEQGLER